MFIDTFEAPAVYYCTPTEPEDIALNEYTVWLTVRGVEHAERITRTPSQPLTLSEVMELQAKLNRDFFTCSPEESMRTLDMLQDFFSLMLRYPMLPRLAVDTKECPECYFETEITMDTWEDVKLSMSCYHYTLRHELFPSRAGNDTQCAGTQARSHKSAYQDDEMVRLGPCANMFMTEMPTSGPRGGSGAIAFLEQLDALKKRDEIMKQNALAKDIYHRFKSHSRTLDEIEAPRYLSTYPLRCLYQYYGSLNRSRLREELLCKPYPELGEDTRRCRSKLEDLRSHLRSTASTGTNDRLLSYMCMASIGPVRRYTRRYSHTAERIVLFKHLIACGFPIETASGLIGNIISCNRLSMISVTLDNSLDIQLRKTVQPTRYNRTVATLIWLFAHITAYCTLRGLDHGYVLMGDTPKDMHCDGIYVFDKDSVGFRLSPASGSSDTGNTQRSGSERERSASACMPFACILELLALRDSVQERFRRQNN